MEMFKFSNQTYETIYSGLRRIDGPGTKSAGSSAEKSGPARWIWVPSALFAVIAALVIV